MPTPKALSPEALKCLCNAEQFKFKTTKEIDPLTDVIGQQRAVQAIEFGLNMDAPGYHIFVTGLPGTGKSTIVQDIVGKHASQLEPASGWCLVNNFEDEYRPIPIETPSGRAVALTKKVAQLVEGLRSRIPKEFDSDDYQKKKAEIEARFAEQKKAYYEQLNQSASEKQLQIAKTASGYQSIPLKDGKPMEPDAFQQLPEAEQKAFAERVREMMGEIEAMSREVQKLNQKLYAAMEEFNKDVALFIVRDRVDVLRDEFRGWKDILTFLNELQADIVENVKYFVAAPSQAQAVEGGAAMVEAFFKRYQVNLLVDRREAKGAPVVFEPNPSYQNVFGRIEKRAVMGTLETDFTMVQAGSLLQANGGFLIMEIDSILLNAHVWEALKRALQNKQLQIEDISTWTGFGTASLRPLPMNLDVKIILLGNYDIFHMLQTVDTRFRKIFKVRADFDYETGYSPQALQQYAAFVARVCHSEKLLPLTADGVAAVVEYGEKLNGHQSKLSLRFGPIVDLIREAEYWARKASEKEVNAEHVSKAIEQYRLRYNMYEEKIHEHYLDDTVMVDVAGAEVGQVNALAVYQAGELAFGRPSRITAETFMGKAGVINIEREAKLSGKTHDKGVLILSGYLGRTFAQQFPLSLSISVTFEQSYGGIDGDSASSTELYAILSSLSGVAIKQGLAVTGSVNQKGQVQAIGGVNEKIEGFYEVCKAKGLTGDQGVLIPQANVNNLVLKKEVIEAVAAAKFHIFPVAHIEEGIELLTGLAAGVQDDQGNYPDESLFGRVAAQLATYYQRTIDAKKQEA